MIFSDSRQETAHQAGYIRDRHQEFSMRQAVYRAILSNDERNGAAISLRQLATRTYNWMEQEYGELAAYTLLTPVDAQRQDEATRVVDPPKIVSSYMRENAIKRLARIIHEESKTSTLCRILR